MEQDINKIALLKSLYQTLANKLESTNTFLKNNPKKLKNLFYNYHRYNSKKQNNVSEKIYETLTKIRSKHRIEELSSEIIKDVKTGYYRLGYYEQRYIQQIIGYGTCDICDAMKKVFKEYKIELQIQKEKDEREENRQKAKKELEEKTNSTNNAPHTRKSNTYRTSNTTERQSTHSESIESENVNKNSAKTNQTKKETNPVKNIAKCIRKNSDVKLLGYSEKITKIIEYLIILNRVDFKSLSQKEAKWYKEIIVELIYLKISLKAKGYHNLPEEEQIIVNLLNHPKYDPLNIIKAYEKKQPKYFSCSETINLVNDKLTNDINQMLMNVPFEISPRLCYSIPVMTSLMSIEKIENLYRSQYKKHIEDVSYPIKPEHKFHDMKILQSLFAPAIRDNPNYDGFPPKNMNADQLSKFRHIEIVYICVNNFGQLPAFSYTSTKEELCEYIMEHCPDKNIAKLMVEKIMNKEYIYDSHHKNLEIYKK